MGDYERPCDRDIACMDVGTKFLSGTKKLTVHRRAWMH